MTRTPSFPLSLACAACLALPFLVQCENAADPASAAGPPEFEPVPDWGLAPDGVPPGTLHGDVAVDREGLVYVPTNTPEGVLVYSADGERLRSLGGEDFTKIHSIKHRVEKGEDVFYSAQLTRFIKFDREGEILLEIPNELTGEFPLNEEKTEMGGTFKGATGITVLPDGTIYGSCGYGNNLVYVFDSGGKYLRAFGSKGKEPGSFTTCHGLAYDDRYEPPRLLVCDRDNRRLQHFTLEGEFLSLYGPELRRPCAAAIRGDLVALAEIEGAVALLDPEGNLVARIGDNPDQTQWANPKVALVDMLAGKYTTPHGLCWDNEGGLLVSEWNRAGRVVKMVQR